MVDVTRFCRLSPVQGKAVVARFDAPAVFGRRIAGLREDRKSLGLADRLAACREDRVRGACWCTGWPGDHPLFACLMIAGRL